MISKFLAFEIDFKSQKHAISSKYKENIKKNYACFFIPDGEILHITKIFVTSL